MPDSPVTGADFVTVFVKDYTATRAFYSGPRARGLGHYGEIAGRRHRLQSTVFVNDVLAARRSEF